MLPLVLIVLVALELAAHGALLMARQEEAASRVGTDLLQARLAAESGLRAARGPVRAAYDDVAPWGTVEGAAGAVGAGRFHARLRRLSRERWLIESRGGVEPHPWRIRAGRLVWLPDPVARVRAFGAVVVVGSDAEAVGEARIETAGVRRDGPELDRRPCGPWLAELDSLFDDASVPPVRAEIMEVAREPSLGALGRDELLGWIGTGGAHGSPRAFAGDAFLEREESAGLLVAAGDVVLEGGRHEGVVLAGGRLRLRGGAEVVGFVRAYAGVDIALGSRVVGSGCRALVALAGGLGTWVRPLPVGPGRLPLY